MEEEVAINAWGVSTTHGDLWFPSQKLAIEVKSTTAAGVENKSQLGDYRAQVLARWLAWMEAGECVSSYTGEVLKKKVGKTGAK